MNIEEGNKLIAEFMGLVENPHHKGEFGHNLHYEEGKLIGAEWWRTTLYHSSWDWLMPVVEKIYDTADEDVREINSTGLLIFELGLCTPINEVWKAVIEYLQTLKAE